MKKYITLFLVLFYSFILIGCTKPGILEEKQVKEIIKSKVPGGNIVEFKFNNNDEIPNYDIILSDGEYKYDYKIDATDGTTIKEKKEQIKPRNNQSDENIQINEAKAKEIALNQVTNGSIIEYEFNSNEDIPNYKITVSGGDYKYKLKINATDGSIIKKESEKSTE